MLALKDSFDFIDSPLLATSATALTVLLLALVLHAAALALAGRLLRQYPYALAFLRHSIAASRLLLPALALQAVWETAPASFPGLAGWRHATLLVILGATTWLASSSLAAMREVIMLRYAVDHEDNLLARRVLTQTTVLIRSLSGMLIFLGVAAALMTFPEVRHIGASLLASAGLAGLVLGFAAKPVLGNLIAGLQLAVAQPMRIDDVLIVEGEWGRVEEITGAYVVVKLWDERRLIVPLQWFIEHPFQNWTRHSARIIGSIFLWVDYRLPLTPLREELQRVCRTLPEWDHRLCLLQVTDASERAMQLRILVSSADASRNWDLRCKLRESLIDFLQQHYPSALPRCRVDLRRSGGE